jgi:hypothetical protein
VQVNAGLDPVVGDPGIDDALEAVTHADGETPLGNLLTSDIVIEVGNDGLWGRNEDAAFLFRRRHWSSGWLGTGLRRRLGDRPGGAELADVDERVYPAFVQWDAAL